MPSFGRATGLALAALFAMAQAPGPDPYVHIVQPRTGVIDCGGRAISLDGSHSDVQLSGHCPMVQVTGEHNDIFVPVPPAGTIAVVAPHNDITWRQVSPGPPPRLLALAPSNSFHAR